MRQRTNSLLTPFRVGLLVLLSGACLFVFLTFVRKGGLSANDSVDVYAYFTDASGLGAKSRVQIAGIAVGEIQKIELEANKAKVWLRIRKDVGVREDAALTKRSESLLGDYMLDLFPGTQAAPPMATGGEIRRVYDRQGVEQVFESLNKITSDIQEVTASLRRVLGGDKGTASLEQIVASLRNLTESVDNTIRDSSGKLNSILGNFESFSQTVAGMADGQEAQVRQIVSNINRITLQVSDVLSTVQGVLGSEQGDIKEGVASIKQSLNRLEASLANLEEITTKVKDGQGVAGKLLTDERLGQKVSESVDELSTFADRVTRLQTEVAVRTEYLMSQGTSKNTLAVRLIPRPDKYYLLELVDDPRGVVEQQVVQTNPPQAGQPVEQVQTVRKEGMKFSAQFAKRFYWSTLRFGLIESSGGVGADFHFLNDRITVTADAFNFAMQEATYPRLRTSMRFSAFNHLFASAGVDDLLNSQIRDTRSNKLITGRDYFLGGGIFFTDDDLKAILTTTGVPTPK